VTLLPALISDIEITIERKSLNFSEVRAILIYDLSPKFIQNYADH